MAQEPGATPFDHLVGLSLEAARASLPPDVTLVETKAPFTGKFAVPIYGEARVVRVRSVDGLLEVTTTLELVGETRLPQPEKRTSKRA
jgi:hypothetical protein